MIKSDNNVFNFSGMTREELCYYRTSLHKAIKTICQDKLEIGRLHAEVDQLRREIADMIADLSLKKRLIFN